ncbi:MAG: hypothetical protein C5B47_04545 [Verrucomicrobia bacterium]|nr:MAG: hypothetical protein C5B47_04545 [Verrucomicrobiota bacterium]
MERANKNECKSRRVLPTGDIWTKNISLYAKSALLLLMAHDLKFHRMMNGFQILKNSGIHLPIIFPFR